MLKKPLSRLVLSGLATTLGATLGATVQAATDSGPDDKGTLEEYTVTVQGIRKSIEDSIEVKKNLDVVSDTISAEDVGQFPDNNIAESLQRITGVQITRQSPDGIAANEGQHVSVRGLPSDFNYVALNGEGVASASSNLVAYTSDRNFNFNVLSPDFISALEVYKSPSADFTEGGVAATINVKTVLPLDVGHQLLKLSVEGQGTSRAARPEPDLTALYSNVFADGKLGVTAGYDWNKRTYMSTAVTGFQFDPQTIGGQNYSVLDSNCVFNTRDRYDTKTAYGAVQYRPIDDLTFSLIVLHSDARDEELWSGFDIRPFYATSYPQLVADPNGVVTTQVGDNTYYELGTRATYNRDLLSNFTLKAEWNPGDLHIESALDYSSSRTSNLLFGVDTLEWGAIGVGRSLSGGYQITPGDSIASFVLDPTFNPADPSNYFINSVGGTTIERTNAIHSARLDATYDFHGIIDAVKVGARYSSETSTNYWVYNQDLTQSHDSAAPYVTASPIPTATLHGYNGSANVPLNYPYVNPQAYLGALYNGSYTQWLNSPNLQQILNPTENYTVMEQNTAAYAMARYKFTWGLPVHGNFGVRLVHTQEDVTDTAVDLSQLTVISPPPPPPAPSILVPAGTLYTVTHSYNDVLPSFNLTLDLQPDLLLRFATAKVMSRPTLDSLVPRYSVGAGASNTISGGNPDLAPFRAWQYDLSLEYYFQPGSMASVAGFYKSVDSFIQTQHEPLVLKGVTFDEAIPVNSSGGYVEGVEVGYTQQFTFLPSFLSGFGAQANMTWAQGMTDADPAAGLQAHAFENLSKWTGNASLFYSNPVVNVRLAYNYRSDYLMDDNVRGIGTTSAYGKSFATLDFQASYAIKSYLSVFVEGNNLTRQPQVYYMRVASGSSSTRYPQTWIEGERRLAAGVRLSF